MRRPPVKVTAGMFAVWVSTFVIVVFETPTPSFAHLSATALFAGFFAAIVYWVYIEGYEDGAGYSRLMNHQTNQAYASRERIQKENELLREQITRDKR